jgi:hemolysin type calcium-binding protein/LVIVD repeat-containing protein
VLGASIVGGLLLAAPTTGHQPPPLQEPRALSPRQALEPPLEPTPKADCGPGSRPETGVQGRVSRADHESGRAAKGYTCNAELVGHFGKETPFGSIGGFKVERYVDAAGHECAYYDTTLMFPTNLLDEKAGVNVLDMSDPADPKLTDRLLTPAMLSPHESLVLSKRRGILAAVAGNLAFYPGIVDVYDVSADCRHPVLRSSAPVGVFGHESGMAPDGKTFYSASPSTETIFAVDISDPSRPLPLWSGRYDSHGLSISNDGNRAYVAGVDSGLIILDVSEVQSRTPNPSVREIARLQWESMSIPQNAIPVTIDGDPYLVEIDEYGGTEETGGRIGAGRIIDISDEAAPRVISNLRLEVHQPENLAEAAHDPGADLPVQGYGGHYCNVPDRTDPEIVACSMILSGLRVFDIRDPRNPREIAYFNAPIPPRNTPGFEASNWAMSSPSFVPKRREIWYSDGYSGFYAVQLTNGVWPSGARGSGGCNRLAGGQGKDRLRGTAGNDCIRGRAGADRLAGGAGDDRIRGGLGKDRIRGGGGSDTILAARGSRDRVDCGPGRDTAFAKPGKDRVRRCETVRG